MGRLSGFGVTWRQMFKPRLTTEYPHVKREKPERQHGRHVLNRYEDGMEKCIGCELCAGVCPAKCIYVRGADNPIDDPVSPGERYGFVYEINYLRCIHCDLCVEACPTEAITETKLFEFSFTNRADAIYTKEELVVGDDGRAKRMPWELWPAARTTTRAHGCGRPHRAARRPTKAVSAGRASSASACARPSGARATRSRGCAAVGRTSTKRHRIDDRSDRLLRVRGGLSSPAASASCSRTTRCTPRCSS